MDFDVKTVVAALFSGLLGAVLRMAYDSRRSRIPRIGKMVNVVPAFVPSHSGLDLSAKVTLVHGGRNVEVNNLYIAKIVLENMSNVDFDEFGFAMELAGGDRCVFVRLHSPDASHEFMLNGSVAPDSPAELLSFSLAPFNRKDRYEAEFYLVVPDAITVPNVLKFSSRRASIFVEMQTFGDILVTASRIAAFEVGPVAFGWRAPFSVPKLITPSKREEK